MAGNYAACTTNRGRAELWLSSVFWQRKLKHRLTEGFYGKRADS